MLQETKSDAAIYASALPVVVCIGGLFLEWFVIHHTDCGMETFTDEVMRTLLRQSLDTAELGPDGWKDVGKRPGSAEGDF